MRYIKYTCGCEKDGEFVQCLARQGTNVKCKPVIKVQGRISTNYCRTHLVDPAAPVKYYSNAN